LRFEVTVAAGLLPTPQDGRLLVVLSPQADGDPRRHLGETGLDSAPVLGADATHFGPGRVGILDGSALSFPLASLARLLAGDFTVQAVFDWNPDLRLPSNASFGLPSGTLYSKPRRLHLDPAQAQTVRLELTQQEPEERLPAENSRHRFLKFHSALLSKFHGRPIYLRAGIRLPPSFAGQPERLYPLRVHIGGYGSRYFVFPRAESAGAELVTLVLDGAGPYGDPYQVNSANNGPYGDAVVQELIPFVERRFRCLGRPHARLLDGVSTGGWVSLALQIFYPDFFGGAWSVCPDPVDFRCFQLLNIYQDAHAYVNSYGFERPGMRTTEGEVRETTRHQCQLENVLGRGNRWTLSGQQWGAWNAVFSPRGTDGLPVPLWDPETGVLNHQVARGWQRYDLRLVLEKNWQTLGSKLSGKLHIWAGDADEYFLNNAVHKLEGFLRRARPAYNGLIAFGPGHGHGWSGLTERQLIEQMLQAAGKEGR
jgi:S-formylglutathione hydrolase FrmB